MIAAFLVPLMMFGWILSGLVLCPRFGARQGIAAAVILGWLLLPIAAYPISLLPIFDKHASVALAAMLSLLVFDSQRLAALRPRLIDLPMLVFCLSPMATSIATGLGPYDGYTVVCPRLLAWGIPYLIGRAAFGTIEGMRDLALWTVIGGLVYAPLCLIEVKMSPQLSVWVYGIAVGGWEQTVRWGGWRPTVFLQHGLAVGLFMCSSAFVGVMLWRRKCFARIGFIPMAFAAGLLMVVAILTKSTGAITLGLLAVIVASMTRICKSRIPVIVLLGLAPAYMSVRATGLWSGDSLIQAAQTLGEDQAGSLQMRLTNEDILATRAIKRPVFGWGTWGQRGGGDESGFNTMNAVTDGYWIIILGSAGSVGLISFTTAMLLPVYLLLRRVPPALLFDAAYAPAFAMAVIVTMFMIDCLFNAMLNPIFPVAAGGLAGLSALRIVNPSAAAVGVRGPRVRAGQPSPGDLPRGRIS